MTSNFSYSAWLGADKAAGSNETALSRFLLQSRSGHCRYFATATVLLLRELGMPARYAGRLRGSRSRGGGCVVRERDAHAWCLVWNARTRTWEDFDTTPGSWIAEEAKRAPAWQWLEDGWSWVRFQLRDCAGGRPICASTSCGRSSRCCRCCCIKSSFGAGVDGGCGPKRRARRRDSWPGLDSEFYLIERKLAARGGPRQPGEALSDWLARALADPALAGLREPVRELLPLHYCHRFDPRGLSGAGRDSLARGARSCLETLSRLEGRSERPS